MATQIKLRRDTAANWLLEDPVLGQGEPGFETTTGKLKIGDGTSLWSALDYIVAEPDGSIDLGAVDKHVLPATDNLYDLGSPAKRWRHVYAADGSIYIGDIKLSNSSGTLVVQQVTNAGDISEAPVANPGVVTTDRIINGEHEFSINASGVLQLDGSPYLGGDTALPTNSLGYLYNDGTGTLTWASGAGGGGGTSDRLVNGLNEAVLNSDGSISFPTLTTINWEDGTLTGPTLQMGNDPTVNETVITGPAPTNTYSSASRLIIQGQQGFGGENNNKGEGGDVYIWAGSGGDAGSLAPRGDGGDVKLRGGIGGNDGGYIRLESGDAQAENGVGGFLDLNAGNSFNTGGVGGNVNIRAGEGALQDGQVNITGRTSINTDGGTWNFDSDGSLSSPNGYTLNRGQQQYFAAGDPPTVVYTSQDGTIGAIKAMIKVVDSKPADLNGDNDVDTQVCEILVTVKRRYINGGGVITTPVASVYGVTHTSTLPLATFTVNFVANMSVGPGMTRNVVQILAEPTAAATGNIWVTVAATEMTND